MKLWTQQSKFSLYRPISIQILTWNINALRPAELTDCMFWTNLFNLRLKEVPDVVVIGFQEIVDLESVSFIVFMGL